MNAASTSRRWLTVRSLPLIYGMASSLDLLQELGVRHRLRPVRVLVDMSAGRWGVLLLGLDPAFAQDECRHGSTVAVEHRMARAVNDRNVCSSVLNSGHGVFSLASLYRIVFVPAVK